MFIANEEHTSVKFSIHLDFFVSTLSSTALSEQIILFSFFLFWFCWLQSAAQPLPGKPSIFSDERMKTNTQPPPQLSRLFICVHPTVAQLQCLSTQCFAGMKSQRWMWAAVSDSARLWFIAPFRLIDQSSVLRQIDVAVLVKGRRSHDAAEQAGTGE